MSHAANIKSELSFATIGAKLSGESMGDSSLLRLLDNAGQTVVVRFGATYDTLVDARLEELATRGGWKIGKPDVVKVIQNLYRFHAKVTGLATPLEPYGHDAPTVPKKDFHRFYSLIYHLTPEGPLYEEGRDAIAEVFKKLDLPPPLSKEKLAKNLPATLAFGDPGKKIGRANG